MLIRNANAFVNGHFRSGTEVRIHNGCVHEVGTGLMKGLYEDELDLQGDYLLPGFVDVHIHAFAGHDTMRGEKDVRAMSRGLYRLGVSAFLPTTMSASVADTAAALQGVRAVMHSQESKGARVMGAHMEAPFMQPSKAGAQLKEYFVNPSVDAFAAMGGDPAIVRLISMAPELEGSEAFIRAAVSMGITVSVGHTSATAEQTHQAGDWGANHVTHTFNAQPALHHRAPGVAGATMTDDRFYNELICDGVHLHGDIVRMILRCKGPERAVVITDAMEAAGLPDGTYSLGGQAVYVKGPEARLADGTLAGSVLTMQKALHNLIHRFGIDPETAAAVCTSTPAESIGEKLAGHLIPGSPAPLTRWSRDW